MSDKEITPRVLLDQLHEQERERVMAVLARYACREVIADRGPIYQGGFDDVPEGKNG